MPLSPEEEALIGDIQPGEQPAPDTNDPAFHTALVGGPDELMNPAGETPTQDQQLQSELAYLPSETPTFDRTTLPEQPQPVQSTSSKASVSYRGFGPDQGQGAMRAVGDINYAAQDARLRAERDAQLAEAKGLYSNLGAAEGEHAKVEAQAAEAKGKILQDEADFIRQSAELDKVMHAEAQAKSAAYLDNYTKQMAAVRQMVVVNPIEHLNTWQAEGLSLGMFAQGFLAAQGINIDVSGQVDRWVDRSIEEQKRRIGQAEKGAESQLNLYKIAQETSRDEVEARARYRGMVLEGMQVGVEVNAARFAAPLAQSAANITRAKLGLEQLNTSNAIRQRYEQDTLSQYNAIRADYHQRVQEREIARHNAVEEGLALAKAKIDAGKDVKETNYIIDSRNVQRDPITGKPITGGLAVARFANNIPEETKKEVIAKKTLNDSVQRGTDKLRELYKQLDVNAGPGWYRDRKSKAYTLFNAERTRVVGDVMRSYTGMAATDKEAQRYLDQLKDDSLLQAGGNRLPDLIDNMSTWAKDTFEHTLDLPGVVKLNPDEQFHTTKTELDPEGTALAEARAAAGSLQTPVVEQIAGAAAASKVGEVEHKPSQFYKDYVSNPLNSDVGTSLKLQASAMQNREERGMVHIEDLAHMAVDPEGFFKSKGIGKGKARGNDPEEAKLTAITALGKIADGRPLAEGEPAPPKARQLFARALLDAYEKDPDTLKKALE